MDRKYERFLATLNLARNPGTKEEGEAAWELVNKMASKYGYKIPEAVNEKEIKQEAKDWAKETIWRNFRASNTYIINHLLSLLDSNIYKVCKTGKKINYFSIYGTEEDLNNIIAFYQIYKKSEKELFKLYKEEYGTTKGFRDAFKALFYLGFINKTFKSTTEFAIKAHALGATFSKLMDRNS